MTAQVQYTGHGANTGGLQSHSVGAEYPYMIQGVADRPEQPTQWQVLDTRSGSKSRRFRSYREAEIELYSMKCRNMMHS